VEDVVDTPSAHPISQDVLQRVSRLSGAFVENVGSQKVRVAFTHWDCDLIAWSKLRIRAKHPTNSMLAQRLAVRLHYEVCVILYVAFWTILTPVPDRTF